MDLINNLVFNNELETLRRETRRLQQENRKLIESSNNIKIDPKYNYSYAFYGKQVTDLSGYAMNKCQAADNMFNESQLNENFNFDTSKWTLSNLVNANFMFRGLQLNDKSNFDTSNWTLSNLVNADSMFYGTERLSANSTFDTTRFSLRNLISAYYMFPDINLTNSPNSNFDTSNWDLSNLIDGGLMFARLQLNEKSDFDTSNWDLSNLVNSDSMFAGSNIKELNFSSWKKPNENIFVNAPFASCTSLTKLIAYGAVLKKIATDYGDIDDNTLYEVKGEPDNNGLFKITKFIR